ncbi:hypothetical protein RSAG8_07536, partial [Rhizoctonia solani AG-8 WAC10335]
NILFDWHTGRNAVLQDSRSLSNRPHRSLLFLSVHLVTEGAPHAAEHKAVLVVPVSQMGLKSPEAIHNFKLLTGVRWSEAPPRDAGFSLGEVGNPSFAEHGYIKISSEHFPEVRMNAKWCSDMLDELIQQANDSSKDSFVDLPLDTRHLNSQKIKRRQGGHSFGQTKRATIRDFPQEWLHANA